MREQEFMTEHTLVIWPSPLWLQAQSLWRRIMRVGRRTPKRLRLAENLALGERRFVAVIEFEQTRFLVGGTSSSLVLLANLGATERSAHNVDSANDSEIDIEHESESEKLSDQSMRGLI